MNTAKPIIDKEVKTVIAITVFLIFTGIALLHFYWSFGGQWGKRAALPERNDGTHTIRPGFLSTLMVALGLTGLAVFSLSAVQIVDLPIAPVVKRVGHWMIAVIFLARAVGDLTYVGFLKKIRNTQFARKDTTIYSPLCLLIGMLNVFLAESS